MTYFRNLSYLTLLSFLFISSCTEKKDTPLATKEAPAVLVIVSEVISQDVPLTVPTIGNIYASLTVNIKPQVEGKLLEFYVQEGQSVHQGDLLYSIDPRPYEAILERAKAALAKDEAILQFTKKKLERYTELIKGDYVSQLSVEEYTRDANMSQAQILVDQADIAAAELNLSYCTILAPIDGVLGQSNVNPGNIVRPSDQTPLTTIKQISPADVYFSIPQRFFSSALLGQQEASLKFVVWPGHETLLSGTIEKQEGTVYFIDNTIDNTTGTILLKGHISNKTHPLWPGELVRVVLQLKILPNSLVIPLKAIQYGQKGKFIYIVKSDMTAEIVPVNVIEEFEENVVVTGSLKAGDIVVVDGQIKLTQGSRVRYENQKPNNNLIQTQVLSENLTQRQDPSQNQSQNQKNEEL